MAAPLIFYQGPASGLQPPVAIPIWTLKEKMGGEWLNGFAWNQVYEKCQADMPEFFETYFLGHPLPLSAASQDIETLLWQIKNQDRWQNFRDQIDDLVGKLHDIKTMVCLGLGQYVGPHSTTGNCWIVQYTVFVYMWEKVNEKRQTELTDSDDPNPTPVERIFQDPAIDKRTKYLLQRIPRNTDPGFNNVVEVPEAFYMLEADQNTFVYAPHLPSRLNLSVLSRRPQVFVGNGERAVGGWRTAMMEEYMEECKFEGTTAIGQNVDNLWARICAARQTYREEKMNNEGPMDPTHFSGTSIFLRSA
ncbi:hypothetical protein E4T52_09301 [Aureobasidium sp. EXF-3400]|nr:hypothetical protein E4T51_01420 [Aureobasidium sp. EXF-12344]KAI4775770.1 hypothetical protein E4T52_09301 [Aureobasidium sp. EXF-3400]